MSVTSQTSRPRPITHLPEQARLHDLVGQVGVNLARVVVAPTDYLFAICRMFTSYQATQDIEHPPIVRSRTLAYAELGLSDPDFRPV